MYILTLTQAHVRNPKTLGKHRYGIRDAMGRPQAGDIGKRVYLVGDVYQVESNEQRDKRLSTRLLLGMIGQHYYLVTIKGNDTFSGSITVQAKDIGEAISNACLWYDGLTIESFIEVTAKLIS